MDFIYFSCLLIYFIISGLVQLNTSIIIMHIIMYWGYISKTKSQRCYDF